MMMLGFILRTYNSFFGGYIVVATIYCGIGMALLAASTIYWKKTVPHPLKKSLN
jgi:hypothetical protein